jgi:hypothetical protein
MSSAAALSLKNSACPHGSFVPVYSTLHKSAKKKETEKREEDIMFYTDFSKIDISDIQELITNSVAENKTLEYKQELKITTVPSGETA